MKRMKRKESDSSIQKPRSAQAAADVFVAFQMRRTVMIINGSHQNKRLSSQWPCHQTKKRVDRPQEDDCKRNVNPQRKKNPIRVMCWGRSGAQYYPHFPNIQHRLACKSAQGQNSCLWTYSVYAHSKALYEISRLR